MRPEFSLEQERAMNCRPPSKMLQRAQCAVERAIGCRPADLLRERVIAQNPFRIANALQANFPFCERRQTRHNAQERAFAGTVRA